MSAGELNAACAAGGGHIAVSRSLEIKGGTAILTGECDITPGARATVKIVNARIDATSGDFDVCFSPACGSDAKVTITNSTIIACPACGLQIYAPETGAKLTIKKSTPRPTRRAAAARSAASPRGGRTSFRRGRSKVTKTTFVGDTEPGDPRRQVVQGE